MKDGLLGYLKGRRGLYGIIGAVVLLGFGLFPFYVDVETSFWAYFLFLAFMYICVAQGWNLVAGYTGQISLGTHAFFGIGAFTTAILWIKDITHTSYYFDPLLMILSGLIPVVLAIIIGIPLLSRLRGDYFALGTLGVGQITLVVALKAQGLTGGAMGIHLPSTVYSSMRPYYWVGLLLAVFATAVVYFITRSRIGLALRAVREDETSAASHGIFILKFKVFAFAICAFLAGMAGSLYAYYLFTIQPASVFNLNWLFYPLLMCVLGGTGTILGPVIGAFFATALFTFGDVYFAGYHPIASGILIILVMKFMPGGIIGLKDRIFIRR
ncbi:MAG TPA: branched-chain amino acid ABC transporter permease [Dehalococcoidales bacterium]|nr:branched-chain amino acid ABC transporter permease [Dehalococcoidales bacterium]